MMTNMNQLKMGAVLVATALSALVQGANTWWVDANSTVATANGAESTPYKTIQAAVNASTTVAGDTIKVKPGIYDSGYGLADTISTNRVFLSKKLTLVSTGGKAVTHIVGRHASDSTLEGLGTDAVRCIYVPSMASDSVIQGFTLRDGGTQGDNQGGQNCGGAVFAGNASNVHIVDCVISNCVGTRGAAIYGKRGSGIWGIRTLICNNRAPGSGTRSILRDVNLFNCVVAHNVSTAYTFDYPGLTLNCTFFENQQANRMFQALKCRVLNSILMTQYEGGSQTIGDATNYGKSNDAATYVTNCVANTKTGPGEFVSSVVVAREQLKGSAPDGDQLMPIASSPAVGFGNVEYLQLAPAAYRDMDFYGNPRTTNGKVNAGAVEGYAQGEATGGFARFFAPTVIEGVKGTYQKYGYYHPDSAPAMVKAAAVVPNGLHLYRYSLSGAFTATHYPETDGSFGLYIPPSTSSIGVTPVFTGKKLFVDVNDAGEDAVMDGTEAHPFKSIMGAIAAASASTNTIIEVAAGNYSTGEGVNDCYGYRRVVIDKPVFIRGAGRGKSIIQGAPATGASTTASPWGCGDDAVGCVIAKNVNCALQGFTLTDGYTRPQANNTYAEIRGGGFFEVASQNERGTGKAHLLDCTITNCVATRSAAVGGGCRMFRCVVTQSRGTNNGVCQDGGLGSSCIMRNNPTWDAIGNSFIAYNCTIDPGTAWFQLMNPYGKAYNCVFANCRNGYVPPLSGTANSTGSVAWGADMSKTSSEVWNVNPNCVDPSGGDYRLLSASAILGAGDLAHASAAMFTSDFYGRPLIFKNGQPTPGACQELVPGVILEMGDGSAPSFTATVNGSSGALTNRVDVGDAVSVTYTGARHFTHFEVDGVTQTVGLVSMNLTVPEDVSGGWGRVVAVLDNTYYADAGKADDSGNGWTPATAKKTLVAALALAVSGDVVHAAEGMYDEGSADQGFKVNLNASERTVRARAPVPAGVRLVADGAVERTIIQGGKAPAETARDEEGMGPGAVRCVSLDSNASVEGFTIVGGRCLIPEGASSSNQVSPSGNEDYNGGGVLGVSYDQVKVIGCVVTNCVGCRGGAGWNVTFYNCRILENMSCWNAPAGSICRYYDCLVDGNRGENTSQDCKGYYNCVYSQNNCWGGTHYSYAFNRGSKTLPVVAQKGTPVRNSVFLQSYYSSDPGVSGQPSYCAIVRSDGTLPSAETWSNAVVVTSRDALMLDENYRPLKGSPLIDAGDRTAWEGTSDLGGGQRVYNGQIDIGAFEYDWRPTYSVDLGTTRFAVTNATSDVYEKTVAGAKVVALAKEGDTVAGIWMPRASGSTAPTVCYMTATLTAAGTLTVTKNGEPYASYTETGRHEIRAAGTVNGDQFAFAWTPAEGTEAEAYLSGFNCPNGTFLIFR